MTKEKSQAELEIDALAEVFGIATTGFEEYYKNCQEKSRGNYSAAASSGNYSTAASSGYYSTAASSGNYSTAASSGYSSKGASSSYSSKAASSGNYSTAASSGNYSMAASSGDSSKAASSGYSSTAASSGNYSKSASSGDSSKAASSGDYSKAASSGYYSKAASSGNYSKSASSGDSSKAASSGDYSKAASSGEHSACTALGYRAAVKGDEGNLLMASEYVIKDNKCILVGGKADLVDGKKLKAAQWYIVEGGKWVAVDFSDGIFSYVLSDKKGVKKVKTEKGEILYVVSDDNGNSAHGKTIKEAQADLVYKAVAKFDGKLPKFATGKEWVGIYRSVTGACAAGVKIFVDGTGKSLDKTYAAEEIADLVKGQYGADKFAKKVKDIICQ
jgi:hypothetical protein